MPAPLEPGSAEDVNELRSVTVAQTREGGRSGGFLLRGRVQWIPPRGGQGSSPPPGGYLNEGLKEM